MCCLNVDYLMIRHSPWLIRRTISVIFIPYWPSVLVCFVSVILAFMLWRGMTRNETSVLNHSSYLTNYSTIEQKMDVQAIFPFCHEPDNRMFNWPSADCVPENSRLLLVNDFIFSASRCCISGSGVILGRKISGDLSWKYFPSMITTLHLSRKSNQSEQPVFEAFQLCHYSIRAINSNYCSVSSIVRHAE